MIERFPRVAETRLVSCSWLPQLEFDGAERSVAHDDLYFQISEAFREARRQLLRARGTGPLPASSAFACPHEENCMTATEHSTWDDVRRIVDELEVKIHLAGMDARDRWRAIQPRLAKLEKTIERKSRRTGHAMADELSAIGKALRELRDQIAGEIADARR
jgi:hypothetical protein